MNYFEKHPSTLGKKEALKIIHNFNKVEQVLIQYEMLYMDAWSQNIEAIKSGDGLFGI